MVTRNAVDYIPLTGQFAAEGRPHCGLLLVPPSLPNDQHWRIGHAIVAYDRAHPNEIPPYTVDLGPAGVDALSAELAPGPGPASGPTPTPEPDAP
jgi:hypothetical protein